MGGGRKGGRGRTRGGVRSAVGRPVLIALSSQRTAALSTGMPKRRASWLDKQ